MPPQSDFLIQATNICHRYDDQWVLENIDFRIAPKEILTLIGPNGAGKSTLLSILLGLTQPTQGKVIRRHELKIGYMPQKIQIDPTLPLTVRRFLQLGLKPNNNHSTWSFGSFSGFGRQASKPQANIKRPIERLGWHQIIDQLNLTNLLKKPIQKVSGGEMQRILLARALLRQPDILVLDEPVQGVDLQGQAELYQYINELRNLYGTAILMVSHDLHLVMNHTDQVICLNQHVCCSGHPHSVSQAPEFQVLFGDFTDTIAIYEHHHSESCDHTHGHAPIHLPTDSKEPK